LRGELRSGNWEQLGGGICGSETDLENIACGLNNDTRQAAADATRAAQILIDE
jgi:hypothetical protein